MIDISAIMYNRVKSVVIAKYEEASAGTVDTDTPPSFPHIAVVQIDNPVAKKRSDSDGFENAVYSVIQITIYTKGDTSLSDNKEIQKIASDEMINAGYVRTFGFSPVKNVLDPSVMRYVAKFKALVDGEAIYNN